MIFFFFFLYTGMFGLTIIIATGIFQKSEFFFLTDCTVMALTKLSTSKRFITMIICRTYLDIIPILFKFAGSFYFDSTLSNSFKLFPP